MRYLRSHGLLGASGLAALMASPVAVAGQEEGGGSAIFSLEYGLVLWTWILFLITLAILAWKVFPAIAGGLEERQRKIQDAIDEARNSREAAERYREEQREALEAARREAQSYMEEGRAAAEGLKKEILAEAHQQQKDLLDDARRELEVEREKLAEDLRRESIEVSIAAAERLMRAHMNAEENRRLVTGYMSELQ